MTTMAVSRRLATDISGGGVFIEPRAKCDSGGGGEFEGRQDFCDDSCCAEGSTTDADSRVNSYSDDERVATSFSGSDSASLRDEFAFSTAANASAGAKAVSSRQSPLEPVVFVDQILVAQSSPRRMPAGSWAPSCLGGSVVSTTSNSTELAPPWLADYRPAAPPAFESQSLREERATRRLQLSAYLQIMGSSVPKLQYKTKRYCHFENALTYLYCLRRMMRGAETPSAAAAAAGGATAECGGGGGVETGHHHQHHQQQRQRQQQPQCFFKRGPNDPELSSPVEFAERLASTMQCKYPCYALALLYIERLLAKFQGSLQLDCHTFQRMTVVAVVVAAKFFDDLYYSNVHYATQMGFDLETLNFLEVCLLVAVDFDLRADIAELRAKLAEFDEMRERCCMQEERDVRCGAKISKIKKTPAAAMLVSKMTECLPNVRAAIQARLRNSDQVRFETEEEYLYRLAMTTKAKSLHRILTDCATDLLNQYLDKVRETTTLSSSSSSSALSSSRNARFPTRADPKIQVADTPSKYVRNNHNNNGEEGEKGPSRLPQFAAATAVDVDNNNGNLIIRGLSSSSSSSVSVSAVSNGISPRQQQQQQHQQRLDSLRKQKQQQQKVILAPQAEEENEVFRLMQSPAILLPALHRTRKHQILCEGPLSGVRAKEEAVVSSHFGGNSESSSWSQPHKLVNHAQVPSLTLPSLLLMRPQQPPLGGMIDRISNGVTTSVPWPSNGGGGGVLPPLGDSSCSHRQYGQSCLTSDEDLNGGCCWPTIDNGDSLETLRRMSQVSDSLSARRRRRLRNWGGQMPFGVGSGTGMDAVSAFSAARQQTPRGGGCAFPMRAAGLAAGTFA